MTTVVYVLTSVISAICMLKFADAVKEVRLPKPNGDSSSGSLKDATSDMKLKFLIKSALFFFWNVLAMYLIRIIIPKYVVVSDNQSIYSFLTTFFLWFATGICFVGIIVGTGSVAMAVSALLEGSKKESE